MTDWVRVDYDDDSTWFEPGDRVQYLRWLGADGGWVLVTGEVRAPEHDPKMMWVSATIGNHGSVNHFANVGRPTDFPSPPERSADWWRPDPMLEFEDRRVVG